MHKKENKINKTKQNKKQKKKNPFRTGKLDKRGDQKWETQILYTGANFIKL